MPGLSAIPVVWQKRLGIDLDIGALFLKPTDRRAESYPCPSPGGMGCPRQIIDNGHGQIVAVCRDEDGTNCNDVRLRPEDIVVYELNRRGLASWAAQALGVKSEFASVEGAFETYRIGDFHPIAGKRFPIFLLLCYDDKKRMESVIHLCCTTSVPFILLTPTPRSISQRMLDLLQGRQARFYPLSDLLVADGDGNPETSPSATEVMASFRAMVLPEPNPDEPTVRFPTPPDTTWRNLRMSFIDGHRMTIFCKGITETVNFSTMGIENRQSREPSVQWLLLQAFARNHGKITWHSSEASDNIPKQVSRLNQELQRFFGISERPIIWKKDEKAYCAAFNIHWESEKPIQVDFGKQFR